MVPPEEIPVHYQPILTTEYHEFRVAAQQTHTKNKVRDKTKNLH